MSLRIALLRQAGLLGAPNIQKLIIVTLLELLVVMRIDIEAMLEV